MSPEHEIKGIDEVEHGGSAYDLLAQPTFSENFTNEVMKDPNMACNMRVFVDYWII